MTATSKCNNSGKGPHTSTLNDATSCPPKAVTYILSIADLADEIAGFQGRGFSVGLCHGCFDLLHTGHARHFEAARAQCDVLVVSVTPDKFVGKGPGRPIFSEQQRAELIASLSVVTYSCINHWETAVELLAALKPNSFFKGQEYEDNAKQVNPNFLIEKQAAEKTGIDVKFTYEEVCSSSNTLKSFQNISPDDSLT